MKPGSILLNLSRGFVVDPAAVRDGIVSGHLAGAAIDVFPEEPKRKGDPFESELRGLPNVILTPHTGGSTEEAQEAIGQFVANKVRDYLATGPRRCRSICRTSRWTSPRACTASPTCTATSPACWPPSTRRWPSTA